MQIAVRKQILIQFDHFAGGNGLRAQRFDLLVAAVDPDYFIGIDQRLNFFEPAEYRDVRGHFFPSLRSIFEQIHYIPPGEEKQMENGKMQGTNGKLILLLTPELW
jgi:hypothetical protein